MNSFVFMNLIRKKNILIYGIEMMNIRFLFYYDL